jgi:3-oxoacyl-[acyl-carrier protein] reductase
MKFKDKVVLITGGASGIGKEAAIQFAKNGAKIGIFDINHEKTKSAKEEILVHCNECAAIIGDVRKKDNVDACIEKLYTKFGDVHFLINNAGILKVDNIDKTSEKMFDDVIATNLKGAFLFTQACVKRWIKEPRAQIKAAKKKKKTIPRPVKFPERRIINISSLAAEGNIGEIAYSSAKAGLLGMTKTSAKELIQYNIKTHAILPAIINTPMIDELFSKDVGKWKKFYESKMELGIGEPKNVADVILFLCGGESCFMNGALISINCGSL